MTSLRTKKYYEAPLPGIPENPQQQTLSQVVEMVAGRINFLMDQIHMMDLWSESEYDAGNMLTLIKEMNEALITRISVSQKELSWYDILLPFGKKINMFQKEILALVASQIRAFALIPSISQEAVHLAILPLVFSDIFTPAQRDEICFLAEQFIQDTTVTTQKYGEYDAFSWKSAINVLLQQIPEDHKKRIDGYVFKWNVSIRVFRGSILFFFEDQDDYKKIRGDKKRKGAKSSGVFFSQHITANFYVGNLVFINGWEDFEAAVLHEIAHRKNAYIRKFLWRTHFKWVKVFSTMHDEIISFMEEEMGEDELKKILLLWTSIYNPVRKKDFEKETYSQIRSYYKRYGKRFIEEAFRIKKQFPNLHLPLLAVTPIELWKYLLDEDVRSEKTGEA
jgi:hypothetical protein